MNLLKSTENCWGVELIIFLPNKQIPVNTFQQSNVAGWNTYYLSRCISY